MRAPIHPASQDALFRREAIDDPASWFGELRTRAPIARIGTTGVHTVATWDRIEEVLRREDDFSANLTGVLVRASDGQPEVFGFPDLGANHVIATADEPAHGVHRSIVQPHLAAGVIEALAPEIEAWTQSALDPWIDAGGGDFVPISEVIPARAVARLLGLPDADVGLHRKWSMMGGDILAGVVEPARMVELATATGQMAEYLGIHLDRHFAPANDDAPARRFILASLAGAVSRGTLTRHHAIGIAIVMFGAGGESTAALIGSCARRLGMDSALAEALRSDPSAIPRFIEEVVRLEPPFKFHYRAVRRPCSLAGFELDLGDRLMLLWSSANRDPAVFEDPDALRLDRRHPKLHMGFGRGAHFCIGAPLARMEARVVVERLLARTRSISLVDGQAGVYVPSIFVRRLERLPLEVIRA